jgi:hypothetical protein
MLLRNDLLRYEEDEGRTVRILWLRSDSAGAAIIDVLADKALPAIVQLDTLIQDLQKKRAKLVNPDPYCVLAIEAALPDSHRAIRDNAWAIIKDLVEKEPDIYRWDRRGKMLKSAMAEHKVTLKTLYRYLRRYWQRGQTPNALLPDYANSGGRGKERKKTGKKLGRPRIYGNQEGINVTSDMRQVFQVAIDRYYAEKGSKFTLKGAYDEMIRAFFSEKRIDPESGEIIHIPKGDYVEDGFPTTTQFRYWFDKGENTLDVKRRRVGPRTYDKDMRGLLSTSAAETWGPGARYQIDATLADVYLVSRLKRDRIIGRPVLYVVIDVFSRMIVGLYVGLEGPSWVGAMMALANTAADKVAYCKQFGREIEADDWPCHHLPANLLGDRGEIESRYIETLANNFRVNVENAAPYRADWKGIVEQRFRLLPAKFKPYVPGYIQCDFRERGGTDYRLDAVLDLYQFTRIVIDCALHYNNHHEIKGYDKNKDMAADDVPAIPIELWDWGIANRSGQLRSYPEERVRFSLLPVDSASVTELGIYHDGCYYSCAEAVEQRWFDRARQQGRWRITVSHDPRSMDDIYLHAPESSQGFIVCQMTERSRADRGMSSWEIGQRQFLEKDQSATRAQKQQMTEADLATKIEGTVGEAIAMRAQTDASDRARTKNIRANRAEEKQLNRQTEAFRLGNRTEPQQKDAEVIPLRPMSNYSEPDITEILGSLDDDKP